MMSSNLIEVWTSDAQRVVSLLPDCQEISLFVSDDVVPDIQRDKWATLCQFHNSIYQHRLISVDVSRRNWELDNIGKVVSVVSSQKDTHATHKTALDMQQKSSCLVSLVGSLLKKYPQLCSNWSTGLLIWTCRWSSLFQVKLKTVCLFGGTGSGGERREGSAAELGTVASLGYWLQSSQTGLGAELPLQLDWSTCT